MTFKWNFIMLFFKNDSSYKTSIGRHKILITFNQYITFYVENCVLKLPHIRTKCFCISKQHAGNADSSKFLWSHIKRLNTINGPFPHREYAKRCMLDVAKAVCLENKRTFENIKFLQKNKCKLHGKCEEQ
jgi:hypothetical protein